MINKLFEKIPENILEQVYSLELDTCTNSGNQAIEKLLERTVLKSGKRLRPLLTYLMADLFELDTDQTSKLAISIEEVHAASLAHDDVIDNATTRRNSPSINILGSNKMAILAGDYLLSDVIIRLSKLDNPKLIKLMASVIQDLAKGEWAQHEALLTRTYSLDTLLEIAKYKTGSIMSFCAAGPAIAKDSNLDEELLSNCIEFGVNLGIAFQLRDDTLDFSANSDKDTALDLENNQLTAVTFNFLSTKDLLYKYVAGDSLVDLIDLKEITESVETIINLSQEYLNKAKANLAFIQKATKASGQRLEPIESLLSFLVIREN